MHIVRLDVFEGPLDLLLHLLDKEELEITEVSVAQVTDQYLEYVRTMQELDLDRVSEFAVMAARLLEIKARHLLPARQETDSSDAGQDDPETELVLRLLEYRQFKEAADLLRRQAEQTGQRYPRFPEDLPHLAAEIELQGLKLADLLRAMERVLQNAPEQDVSIHVERESFTVDGSMRRLMAQLSKNNGRLFFHDMFRPGSSRLEIVVTFLALLELLRRRKVAARQHQLFGDIEILLLPSPVVEAT